MKVNILTEEGVGATVGEGVCAEVGVGVATGAGVVETGVGERVGAGEDFVGAGVGAGFGAAVVVAIVVLVVVTEGLTPPGQLLHSSGNSAATRVLAAASLKEPPSGDISQEILSPHEWPCAKFSSQPDRGRGAGVGGAGVGAGVGPRVIGEVLPQRSLPCLIRLCDGKICTLRGRPKGFKKRLSSVAEIEHVVPPTVRRTDSSALKYSASKSSENSTSRSPDQAPSRVYASPATTGAP